MVSASWDELCLLCGICGGQGPRRSLPEPEAEALAKMIAQENEDSSEDVSTIINDAFATCPRLDLYSDGDPERAWLPEDIRYSDSYDACIAIGYFCGAFNEYPHPRGKYPDGKHVRVRRVGNHFREGFETILEPVGTKVLSRTFTNCGVFDTAENPSFYICERCYVSLKAWIDWDSLPPPLHTTPFPTKLETLTFDGELYEIVRSRQGIRGYATLLPCIGYDGIEKSLNQWQESFVDCRRGSRHVISAIRAGMRGEQLIPPLLRDCRAWMFVRPDIWPSPSKKGESMPIFQPFEIGASNESLPITLLPSEIFLQIIRDLPLISLLNLSGACRTLRTAMTEPTFLDLILKDALMCGSLRWIFPIESFRDEKLRAYKAIRLWIPNSSTKDRAIDNEVDMSSIPSIRSLLLSPTFPRLAFIRACWDSDFMMNRKRIWEQVKQFETLWVDYRVNGCKFDMFFPSSDILHAIDAF